MNPAWRIAGWLPTNWPCRGGGSADGAVMHDDFDSVPQLRNDATLGETTEKLREVVDKLKGVFVLALLVPLASYGGVLYPGTLFRDIPPYTPLSNLVSYAGFVTTNEFNGFSNRITNVSAARPLPKYLHALDFADSYPEAAAEYYRSRNGGDASACASARDGNTYSRNFDFPFDDRAEFVVKMAAGAGRFASVGVAQVGTNLTEQIVTSGKPSKCYKWLPGATVDGINENGVVANINVVDGEPKDYWPTTGTIHCLGAVRWVLDNATNAASAASVVAAGVYFPVGWHQNYHWMIADAEKTYIVENGAAHEVTNAPAVMTNFRLYPTHSDGAGQERYALLTGGANITNAWYTRCYSAATNPKWVSEFGGDESALDAAIAFWEREPKEAHRGESFNGTNWWQSIHTSVYDISNRVLRVAVQEMDDWYTFACPRQVTSLGGLDAAAVTNIASSVTDDALTNYYSRSELQLKEVTYVFPEGMTWIQSGETSGRWYGIAYGGGSFVAGSANRKGLWYSDDGGTNWVKSGKTDGTWMSIAYGNGRFVAGGYANATGLWYSDDGGTNWVQSAKTDGNWYRIAYGGGRFVAGSYGDEGLWYSDDGISWAQSVKTNDFWFGIAYGGGRFVAGGDGIGLWYSDDGGTNWVQSAKTDGTWMSIVYGGGRFVAGSESGDGLWYSDDGTNWVQSGKTDGKWAGIAYGKGCFVAEDYGNGFWYSDDGFSWVQSGETVAKWWGIAYGGGRFVAASYGKGIWYSDYTEAKSVPVVQRIKVNGSFVESDSNNVVEISGFDAAAVTNIASRVTDDALTNYYSRSELKLKKVADVLPGGVTWVQSAKTDGNWYCVAYGGGRFVAGSANRKGLWYSDDGISWTQSEKKDGDWLGVAYGNGRFVAGSDYGNVGLWYSDDGISWTQSKGKEGSLYIVAYGNGRFVAGSCGVDLGIWYSDDGVTWVKAVNTDGQWYGLAYGNGRFVASGGVSVDFDRRGLWYSDDGANWVQSAKTNGTWHGIAYGGGRFVAGNYIATGLWYSDDGGTNWVQSGVTNGGWNVIAYGNRRFVAGSDDLKGLWYSDDGFSWVESEQGGGDWHGIAYGGGRFVAGSFSDKGLWYSDDLAGKSIPVVQRIKVNGEIAKADSDNVVSIEVGGGVDTNTVKEIVNPMIAVATNGAVASAEENAERMVSKKDAADFANPDPYSLIGRITNDRVKLRVEDGDLSVVDGTNEVWSSAAVARKRDETDNRCYVSEGGKLGGWDFSEQNAIYPGVEFFVEIWNASEDATLFMFYINTDDYGTVGESDQRYSSREAALAETEIYWDYAEGDYERVMDTVTRRKVIPGVCVSNELFVTPSFVTNYTDVATNGLARASDIPTEYLKTATATDNSITVTKQDNTQVGLTVNYDYALGTLASGGSISSGEIRNITATADFTMTLSLGSSATASADCALWVDASGASADVNITSIGGGYTLKGDDGYSKITSGKCAIITFTRVTSSIVIVAKKEFDP